MNTASLAADAAATTGVDQFIEKYFGPVSDALYSVVFAEVPFFGTRAPLIVLWLVVAGLFFTVWLKGLNVRGLWHGIQLIRGKYNDPTANGEVTHFAALTTAIASAVGLGSIAGVAVAITIGGPGAAFWMIVAGFLGAATKMAECMLGVKFRKINEDGTVSGGPMYYLRDGLASIGMKKIGIVLSALWAFGMMFAAIGTNAFQANQATQQLVDQVGGGWLGDNRWVIGTVLAVIAGIVVIGGAAWIARAASVLVPAMGVLYVVGCLIIVLANITSLGDAVSEIITGAFNPKGVAGGVIGSLIVGFQRATFMDSAGIGDAPIAHSLVKTNRPATEGFVAAWEPLSTIFIGTLTALAVIVTGTWKGAGTDASGVSITSDAFGTVASWFPVLLTVAIVLFAFTTVLSNCFYGMKGFSFLFKDRKWAEIAYKTVYLVFTVIGSAVALGAVLNFTDSLFFVIAIFNVLGLYLLANVIRREYSGYWKDLKSGKIRSIDEMEDELEESRNAGTDPFDRAGVR